MFILLTVISKEGLTWVVTVNKTEYIWDLKIKAITATSSL